MPKYDVTDRVSINASTETVYNVIIAAYDNTDDWWFPYVSSKILNGSSSAKTNTIYKVTIHSTIPISFITKTIEAKNNELLKVIYTKGAFKGQGVWQFKQENNKTLLSFRWQTSPGNILMTIIALIFPIAKNHSGVMQKGFENLKKKLENRS